MSFAQLKAAVTSGRVSEVKRILARDKSLVKAVPPNSEHKGTLLHEAVKTGKIAVVNEILQAGAECEHADSRGCTPLHLAVLLEDQEAGAQISAAVASKSKKCLNKPNDAGETPLALAAGKGNVSAVKTLLSLGAETDAGKLPGAVAAAKNGHTSVVKAFVDCSKGLADKDVEGFTPLMYALKSKNRDMIDVLLSSEADLNCSAASAGSGETALLIALAEGTDDSKLLVRLLEKGSSGDERNSDGVSALAVAARMDDTAVLAAMLEKGCDLAAKNARGRSAFEEAVIAGRDEAAAAMLRAGADVSRTAGPTLRVALQKRMDALLAELLLLGGGGACTDAALAKEGVGLEKLVSAGLDRAAGALVRRQLAAKGDKGGGLDEDGNTHLHVAARDNGSAGLLRAIVGAGVAVDAPNANEDTPLHVAAKAGHVEVCRALVELGANVFARNAKNRTPRSQVKVAEDVKAYLLDAEEEAEKRKKEKHAQLWDEKMKKTQTESAYAIRGL